MNTSVSDSPQRSRVEKLIYQIQIRLGIHPKWERELVESDETLRIYKEFKDRGMCSRLYYLRINFLKGWIQISKS
jgi:hypothetical protein